MPYPPEHKHATRQKILESARCMFNKRGFSEVTIEEIMADAGLSHGGFYRHFASKEELYAAAVQYFLCKETRESWQSGVGKTRARRIIDAYFSLGHFNDRERCCPLIGLPSDVSRSSNIVKAAYREVVEMLVGVFEAELSEPQARERALALASLCVGGMVVARCVDDPALADEVRGAVRRHALSSAGWSDGESG